MGWAPDKLSFEDDLEMVISKLPCASVSKRIFAQNHSYVNKFDMQENEPVGETHSHVDTFWPKTFDEISDLMDCTTCNKT